MTLGQVERNDDRISDGERLDARPNLVNVANAFVPEAEWLGRSILRPSVDVEVGATNRRSAYAYDCIGGVDDGRPGHINHADAERGALPDNGPHGFVDRGREVRECHGCGFVDGVE